MAGFSTPIIVLVVVCFNTTLFASRGLYLYRQSKLQGGSGSGSGVSHGG